jgi:hypothetical protein
LHAAFEIKVKPYQAAFCSAPQHRFLGIDLKTLVSVYSFVKELMKKRFQIFQTPTSASNTVRKSEVNILTTGMLQLGAVFRFRRSQENRSPHNCLYLNDRSSKQWGTRQVFYRYRNLFFEIV